jgi:hypothetical protein
MKHTFIFFLAFVLGCQTKDIQTNSEKNIVLSSEFKTYWYDGMAEISSFKLSQSRYGEQREGEAILIFVTEDFLTNQQVKANQKSKRSKSVLKLNRTKNFLTGIYPYSIMNSSFTYLEGKDLLAKITTSIQEWCGQAYLQLNKKNSLSIQSHSYFEGEADQEINLKNGLTEDELWHQIRIDPTELPQGELNMLPAFEFLRLLHKPIQYYNAIAVLVKGEKVQTYQINYPELNRKVSIDFENNAPYRILKWEEVDLNDPNNTTIATGVKTLKLPYWQLNHLEDERFRDSLKLN